MKNWVVLLVAVAACGGGSDVAFDEDAVVEALRDGWPGVSDDELRVNQAQVFRDACESGDEAALRMLVATDARQILEAGCPDRVAELTD